MLVDTQGRVIAETHQRAQVWVAAFRFFRLVAAQCHIVGTRGPAGGGVKLGEDRGGNMGSYRFISLPGYRLSGINLTSYTLQQLPY